MEEYIVEALSQKTIGDAFPMMHLVMPKLDLQAWQHFARFALDARRGRLAGILVARRTARRHICGLVCYRLEADFSTGRFLQARHLIGVDMLDPRPIISALISKLGRVAQANGCAAVHVSIPEGDFEASALAGLLSRHELHRRVRRLLNVEFSLKDLASIEEEQAALAG